MPYPTQSQALEKPHSISLESREKLTVTGVMDVESFDENLIVLDTVRGVLLVRGQDLHLQLLSLEGGQAVVDGLVDSLSYEEERKGGLFGRLLG